MKYDPLFSERWKPVGNIETPFKKARQEWDKRMGNSIQQAYLWRLVAFLSLLTTLCSIFAMAYLGALPKAIPHVIEVFPDGRNRYMGDISVEWGQYKPSELLIRYQLERFVTGIRWISSDKVLLKKNLLGVYEMVTESGANLLNEMFQKNNPIRRASTERVDVGIASIIPSTDRSWQIDWRETRWDLYGQPIDSKEFRGIFEIMIVKSSKPDRLKANPLGIYINGFSIVEISSRNLIEGGS